MAAAMSGGGAASTANFAAIVQVGAGMPGPDRTTPAEASAVADEPWMCTMSAGGAEASELREEAAGADRPSGVLASCSIRCT